jgi:short-subunit dehydrogenase
MKGSFRGQSIIVTGASSGIGRALALELARRGARVGLFSRRQAELDLLAAEIRAAGGECLVQAGDTRRPEDVEAAWKSFEAGFRGVDGVILSAGIASLTDVRRLDLARTLDIEDVNFRGPLYWLHAALPSMVARGSGLLCGVTSLGSLRGMPKGAAYSASKAALGTFLESMRLDLRGSGLQVATVLPGFVETPMTDQFDYDTPLLWQPPKAARHILDRLEAGETTIAFPRLLAWTMGLIRSLPSWLYDALMSRVKTASTERPRLD